MSAYNSYHLLFLDTETGGFRVENGLLEVAAILTDITSKTVLSEWSTKILPEPDDILTDAALKICGYDPEVWEKEGIPLLDAITKLREIVGDTPTFLVAHNAPFDWQFIREGMRRAEWDGKEILAYIDTLPMSCELQDLPRHRLVDMMTAFNLTADAYHEALADTRSCRLIYQELRKRGIRPAITKIFHEERTL